MNRKYWAAFLASAFVLMFVACAQADESAIILPANVKAVWDLQSAYRQTTPTRERICLNGLWRWQPNSDADAVPTDSWGYFKVPAPWPGNADWQQRDSQTVYPNPSWRSREFKDITSAWYQREFTVPADWAGRRITLQLATLNSLATVYVDGAKLGEIRFPGGELDITSAAKPGEKNVLSLQVIALPLKSVMISHGDSAAPKQVKGAVERRGLCGDIFLISAPAAARLSGLAVRTSVRKWEITIDAGLQSLSADAKYVLHARVLDGATQVGDFTSDPFGNADLSNGRFAFAKKWKPDKLWDINTPGNAYDIQVELVDAASKKTIDTSWPEHFGFREFWIDGRDFYLNGTRIYLNAVPLDNAAISAATATYEGAKESLRRLKKIGVNFVYTHNYGCQPGTHLDFAEILRAADDAGMLVAFSQPHFGDYDWKDADAEKTNGYAPHAAYYVGVAGNHPSVVAYAMSHNGTGYEQDMNPDMIDGIHDDRDQWSLRAAKWALRAQAIVEKLDPGRIVYHHSSGNLGTMHCVNFYANFAPIQEMSDWFEHWATTGVKPLFTCEYAVPGAWDWTMYRGFYKGEREFGSAAVPWELCEAEWNAQFFGDSAFKIGEGAKTDMRWEAAQFRAGKSWHHWDYPVDLDSPRLAERFPVDAMYITDNFRAFRTWGVSATNCWEYGSYWTLRDNVDRSRKELPVDWQKLQHPGYSPDYIDRPFESIELAYDEKDWIPTAAAEALLRVNQPLLGYIAGKPSAFTSKDQNFFPGQTVEKTLIAINNSRQPVKCHCTWTLGLPTPVTGEKDITIETGQQERVPLKFDLPADLRPETYMLRATFHFDPGEEQTDSFAIQVLKAPQAVGAAGQIAIFDPKGETSKLLTGLNAHAVSARDDLSGYDVLIVGKGALTVDSPAPDISRVRDGLKVIVFEQTPAVLEKRFGFRTIEYGLRNVFRRVPDHPILAGLTTDQLRNWRGASTILPPRLDYEIRPRYGPTVQWCDLPVPQIWRCGNRGDIASALIEKPAVGNFLPIVDGGFSLQYSPLMEYHEGKGMIIFCQMDVTGRTETDPAAQTLVANILHYAESWKPSPARSAAYVGESAGLAHLKSVGIAADSYAGGKLSPEQVLICGPGCAGKIADSAADIAEWLKAGGHLVAVGLDEKEAGVLLPFKVSTKKTEHIATTFDAFSSSSPFAGVGSADVLDRDARAINLIAGGATVFGDGVLATKDQVVFCQVPPWQFETKLVNVKRTWRRSSYLLTRVLANLGVPSATPIIERFNSPAAADGPKPWLALYVDTPEEWDDPYRLFRW